MAFRVIQQPRELEEENVLGQALLGIGQGFIQGRQARREREKESLAARKTEAEIAKLQREGRGILTPAQSISRQKFIQQFGVDPITQQQVSKFNPFTGQQQLLDPRFGFSQERLDPIDEATKALAAKRSGTQLPTPPSGPQGASVPGAALPPQAGVNQPFVPPGGTRFLDPLELEAQQAIAQGADPALVRKRIQELKAQQGQRF